MKSHTPFTIAPVKAHAPPDYPATSVEAKSGRRFLRFASTLVFTGSMVILGSSCLSTTDGDMVACTPGDLYCASTTEISVCTDEQGYEEYLQMTCDDYCEEYFGPGSLSTGGCDAEDTQNPCGCTE